MAKKKPKIEENNRKAYYVALQDYCTFSIGEKRKHDFVEVTEWTNGEGVDVHISGTDTMNFSMTFGQFYAIKDIIKKIEQS